MTKLDPSLCSRATLERLAMADIEELRTPIARSAAVKVAHHEARVAFVAEATPRLRTRAEVALDVVRVLNEWREPLQRLPAVRGGWHLNDGWADRLRALLDEPTAPDPTDLGYCPPDCPDCAHEAPCGKATR